MKNNNLILIGGILLVAIAGGGVAYYMWKKNKDSKKDNTQTPPKETGITEQEMLSLAKSINDSEYKNIVDMYKYFKSTKNKFSESEKQMFLRVTKAMLLAKAEGKWNNSSSLDAKKELLKSYGVTASEIDWFNKTSS
jgi:hypothetical protein